VAVQTVAATRRLTGRVRLGIFLTCLWVIFLPSAYALAAHLNPPFLHSWFEWAYRWWEAAPAPNDPLGLFTSFTPEASLERVALFTFGVPGVFWLLLFVLPKSISWVAEGFRDE
jgi:hypothetical protein